VAKKAKFHLAFFQKKKAKGVEKRPKITNLASKKPNWQPWSGIRGKHTHDIFS